MTDRRICYSCGTVQPWPRLLRLWYAWTDGTPFAFCSSMCASDAGREIGERMVNDRDAADHEARWSARRVGLFGATP